MTKVELKVEKSPALFMEWFDSQMDELLGDLGFLADANSGWMLDIEKLPDPSKDFVARVVPNPKIPMEFAGLDDSVFLLQLYPFCAYGNYRGATPDYGSGQEFNRCFPLKVQLMAFFSSHRSLFGDKRPVEQHTVADAIVMHLEWFEPQMKVTIDYRLVRGDPLSWLLRAFAAEYEETKAQIIEQGVLKTLKPTVLPDEWARWERMGFADEVDEEVADEWQQVGLKKPQKPAILARWKEQYKQMLHLHEQYRFDCDEEPPKWEDIREFFKSETGKTPSERHLRDVKKAGDAGLLK